MKKVYFIILLVAFIGSAEAQDFRKDPVVKLGFNIGGNISNYLTDNKYYDKLNAWNGNFHIAFMQDFMVAKPFYIQTEISYTGLGISRKIDDGSNEISYRNNLHYIQIPALMKLKFGNLVKGYFFTGPYVGFLANANIVTRTGKSSIITDVTEDFKTVDAGLKSGVGVEFWVVGKHNLAFEFRYTQGFIDNNKALPRYWNSSFGLHFMYMFDL